MEKSNMNDNTIKHLQCLVTDFKTHLGTSVDLYTSIWSGLSLKTVSMFRDFLQAFKYKLTINEQADDLMCITVSKNEIPVDVVNEFYQKAKQKMADSRTKEDIKIDMSLDTLRHRISQQVHDWPELDTYTFRLTQKMSPAAVNELNAWLSNSNLFANYVATEDRIVIHKKAQEVKKNVEPSKEGRKLTLKEELSQLTSASTFESAYSKSIERLKAVARSGENKVNLPYMDKECTSYCAEKLKAEGLVVIYLNDCLITVSWY